METNKDIVLIVDDDESVLSSLCKVVESNNILSDTAESGLIALEKLENNVYSLIIMDINMAGIDGFETIKRIREKKIDTPIIIVSGRKEDFDTLYGLDIGADDYITKPFNPVTLGAKIKALIRRDKKHIEDRVIRKGPFTFDTSTLRFFKNDKEIFLTSKENAMIKLFMDSENQIFTKDALYDMIWDNAVVDEQTIIVYINRLRAKIEDNPSDPKYIKTVRGIGYRFTV